MESGVVDVLSGSWLAAQSLVGLYQVRPKDEAHYGMLIDWPLNPFCSIGIPWLYVDPCAASVNPRVQRSVDNQEIHNGTAVLSCDSIGDGI